jgi:hypothetical protein
VVVAAADGMNTAVLRINIPADACEGKRHC